MKNDFISHDFTRRDLMTHDFQTLDLDSIAHGVNRAVWMLAFKRAVVLVNLLTKLTVSYSLEVTVVYFHPRCRNI
jgi:hypothetical protein